MSLTNLFKQTEVKRPFWINLWSFLDSSTFAFTHWTKRTLSQPGKLSINYAMKMSLLWCGTWRFCLLEKLENYQVLFNYVTVLESYIEMTACVSLCVPVSLMSNYTYDLICMLLSFLAIMNFGLYSPCPAEFITLKINANIGGVETKGFFNTIGQKVEC